MTWNQDSRIAILGGGPIALEAALYARTLGFPVSLLEKGNLGEHLRQWGHVRLFTPWHMNTSPLGRRRLAQAFQEADLDSEQCPTGAEFLEQYLLPLTRLPEMEGVVHERARVVGVSKENLSKGVQPGSEERANFPFRVLYRQDKQDAVLNCEIVIDATGVYGNANPLGAGGLPVPGEHHAEASIRTGLTPVRPEELNGKDVLVVGGGMSAATTLATLAGLHPASVTWVTLGTGIPEVPNDPLPERIQLTLEAMAFGTSDRVDHYAGAVINSLTPKNTSVQVEIQTADDSVVRKEVDVIFNHTGFRPDLDLLRELQIHTCYASEGPMKLSAALLGEGDADCMEQVSHGPETLRNPEPGCFVIGHKSYGRNANFLLKIGHDQVRDTFRIITGEASLDLYQPAPSAP